jgi:hypothetical protein
MTRALETMRRLGKKRKRLLRRTGVRPSRQRCWWREDCTNKGDFAEGLCEACASEALLEGVVG